MMPSSCDGCGSAFSLSHSMDCHCKEVFNTMHTLSFIIIVDVIVRS